MADYLYRTTLYTDTSSVVGINVAQNTTDLADWDNNYEALAELVTSLQIAQTTFTTDKTWTQFKALIDGVNITWANVKYYYEGNREVIVLIVNEPL